MRIRSSAALALMGFGVKAEAARPVLHAALIDEDWHVQRIALLALSNLGPSKESIPFLIKTWNTYFATNAAKNHPLAITSRGVLVSMLSRAAKWDPKAITPLLVQGLGNPSNPAKRESVFALTNSGAFK